MEKRLLIHKMPGRVADLPIHDFLALLLFIPYFLLLTSYIVLLRIFIP
jgi:hypothetical protein